METTTIIDTQNHTPLNNIENNVDSVDSDKIEHIINESNVNANIDNTHNTILNHSITILNDTINTFETINTIDTNNSCSVISNSIIDTDLNIQRQAEQIVTPDISTAIDNIDMSNINNTMVIDSIPNVLQNTINNNCVKFKSMNLNEIKTNDEFINDLNINSNPSESEFSYTHNILSPHDKYEFKPTKHIRATKSQKKSEGIDAIDYVYNKLQDFIRYMIINKTNYSIVICKAIEITENYNETKITISKKDICTKALNRLISLDLSLSPFDKHLFIDTISNLIDLMIECSKNTNTNTNTNTNINTTNDVILAKSGQIIHSLIDKLTTIVIKKHYCIEKILVNIATLTNILMILVEKYIYLSGIEKKIIIIQSITNFIKDRLKFIMEISDDNINVLNLSLEPVPLLIDLFISLKKGKFKINTKGDTYIHKKNNKNNNKINNIFSCIRSSKRKSINFMF